MKFHGGFAEEMCLIDDRYTLRIAQTGFIHLSTLLRGEPDMDPEKREIIALGQTADIFALGRIMAAMFHAECKAERAHETHLVHLREMTRNCLNPDTQQRPTADRLKRWAHKMGLTNRNIVELLLNRLKGHADELESEVQARSADSLEERRKLDDLLREMLPRFVSG